MRHDVLYSCDEIRLKLYTACLLNHVKKIKTTFRGDVISYMLSLRNNGPSSRPSRNVASEGYDYRVHARILCPDPTSACQ
jgi:hypothetical protein